MANSGYPIYPDTYKGDYSVTPSRNRQILKTSEKMMCDDITVEPIPSNYGLITWNGSILMVS